MSIIAVAAIGVGAAIGAGVVAASIATVATVITVAAIVGVIGVGLTVVGAVTKNKLLGQIGMVLSMGSLGAVGGAMGAGALGLGGSAGGWAGATGTTAAEQAAANSAGEASVQAAVPSGGAVDFAAGAPQPAGSGVLAPGETASQGMLKGSLVGPAEAPVAAGPANLEAATTIKPVGTNSVLAPSTPTAGGVQGGTGTTGGVDKSGWSKFWDSNAGGAVMAGAPGAVMQGVGGMMQGAGSAKAAEANYQMQQQQLALEKAKWERANSAAPIKFNHTKTSFDPTAPTVG